MVGEVVRQLGTGPEWSRKSPNKGVAAFGLFVVKTCNPNQVQQCIRLTAALGEKSAKLYAAGPRWMIQERVDPCDGKALADKVRDIAQDIRHNCGRNDAGEVVAFDGFATV
jgi:hypothetical protein